MGVKNFEITLQGGSSNSSWTWNSGEPNLVFCGGSTIVGTVRFTIDEKPKVTRGGEKLFIILKFE